MENPVIALSEAINDLVKLLESFNEENFNKVPFEGSWTGAMVAQHLFLALKGVPTLLQTPGEQPERAPNLHQKLLKGIFLNFDTQMKSPDFILPEEKVYSKAQMEGDLKDVNNRITVAAEGQDLNVMSPFKTPGIGQMTRLETMWFSAYHVQRHNHQLANILQKLS